MIDRGPTEDWVSDVIRNSAPPGVQTPCLAPETIAAVVEDSLAAEDRPRVEAHLAGCSTCRSLASSLLAEIPPSRTGARRTAKVLVGAGIAIAASFLVWVGLRTRGREVTDATLAESAEELSRSRPDLFGGFRVLDAAERASLDGPELRGGVRLLRPTETSLDPRPDFVWQPPPGYGSWELRVRRAEGTLLWTSTYTFEPPAPDPLRTPYGQFPALPEGETILWELMGRGPLGESSSSGSFRVATAAEREAFSAARSAITSSAPPALRSLLLSHYAMRKGYLIEAEEAVADHRRLLPDDPIGRETEALVRRRIGYAMVGDS